MQAERKRIDKMNKGMAERTIDAQRVSGERLAAWHSWQRAGILAGAALLPTRFSPAST